MSATPPRTGSAPAPRPAPPVSRYLSRRRRAARFVTQRLVIAPFLRAVLRIEVRGGENLAGHADSTLADGYVLVSNHSSHLDAALLCSQLPWRVTRDLAFGAAADYFFDVAWRRYAAGLVFNTFPIDRTGSGTARGMAFLLVEAGVPIALFPEGTRSRDGRVGRFTSGAALVARRERVPTAPVAIVGAHDAMPPGRLLPPLLGRPPVTIVVGEPVPAHRGERIPDYATRVEGIVRDLLAAGHEAVTGGDGGAPNSGAGRSAGPHPETGPST